MKKIWIATELFFPDETSTSYILTKVAETLGKHFEVTVLTATRYSSNAVKCKKSSYNIKRFASPANNKKNIIKRLFRSIYVSVRFTVYLCANVRKEDSLLTVTNPPLLILFIAAIRKFRKFKWNILVHDVFPENALAAGVITSKNSLKFRILRYFFDKAYSSADDIIVLGRDMAEVLSKKTKNKVKIKIIENWADCKSVYPDDQYLLHRRFDKIILQYAGNVGRVQGLQFLIDAFARASNPKMVLEIYGEGVAKESLVKYVDSLGMANICFKDAFSRSSQNAVLNGCDIAIVTLAEGMYGLGVPSKTYNILAAGKPILFIGEKDSEVGRLVTENQIGFTFSNDDIDSLSNFFETFGYDASTLSEMSQRARRLAESLYSEEVILQKFVDNFTDA